MGRERDMLGVGYPNLLIKICRIGFYEVHTDHGDMLKKGTCPRTSTNGGSRLSNKVTR